MTEKQTYVGPPRFKEESKMEHLVKTYEKLSTEIEENEEFNQKLKKLGVLASTSKFTVGDYDPYDESNYISSQTLTEQFRKIGNSIPTQPLEGSLPPGITGKGDLSAKPHLAYLDPHLEHQMGLGMRYGANKHGFNNHRKMGAEASQHVVDALKRHLNAFLRGEEIDPDSKTSHLACLVNNANFLFRLSRLYGYEEVINNIFGETK